MHKVFAVLVSVFFVLSFVGVPCAAEKGTKPKLIAGAVKAVDLKAKTITLKADKKEDFTCSFDQNTRLKTNNGQNITFADIKVGTILVLLYDIVDGKNVAITIAVARQAAEPAPEKKG